MLLSVTAMAAEPWRYLGLSPPPGIPEAFETRILGNPDLALTAVAFAPDFRHVVLSAIDTDASGKVAVALYEARLESAEWSKPSQAATLLSPGFSTGEAAFTRDGRWLFFSGSRPPTPVGSGPRVFRSRVTKHKFGEPEAVALDVPPDAGTYYPRLLANGDLSFTSRGPNGGDDLFIARAISGGFGKPETLGGDFNSPKDDWDLIESSDGSLRIWVSAREGSVGRTGQVEVLNIELYAQMSGGEQHLCAVWRTRIRIELHAHLSFHIIITCEYAGQSDRLEQFFNRPIQTAKETALPAPLIRSSSDRGA